MFDEDKHYRHEYKYVEPELRLKPAELRLAPFMKKDAHAGSKGYYSIRSLYFDDYYDSFLTDNVNGVDEREKWRIRLYDRSTDFISLERKSRMADLIAKDSCVIDLDIYNKIMRRTVSVSDSYPPLLNIFITGIKAKGFHPAVIVEYERTPFAMQQGNTRITFDRSIRSSSELDALTADRELAARPVLETGQNLLEVKYDAFLPDHIAHALETGHMHRETFSKYYLTRKFNYNGVVSGRYAGQSAMKLTALRQ